MPPILVQRLRTLQINNRRAAILVTIMDVVTGSIFRSSAMFAMALLTLLTIGVIQLTIRRIDRGQVERAIELQMFSPLIFSLCFMLAMPSLFPLFILMPLTGALLGIIAIDQRKFKIFTGICMLLVPLMILIYSSPPLLTPPPPAFITTLLTIALALVQLLMMSQLWMVRTYTSVMAEQRLEAEQANNAKSLFLATMSHELRTPLTAIIGYSEMLQAELTQRPQQLERVERINDAGQQLLTLINSVLDLTKIESGKMELLYTPTDIWELLHDVEQTMAPALAKRRNTLLLERDAVEQFIYADALRLRQILLNLLSNATKFTRGGTISISAQSIKDQEDGWLRITVRDTGIGMTPQQMQIIFEPFTQADQTTTREYGGTGLGLTLTSRLCELMGGRLSVESTPGLGSCFTVELPAFHLSELSRSDEVRV